MLRDRLIDVSMKLGIDEQLRKVRSMVMPRYRHDRDEREHLRNLLRSVLQENSNCVDIGAYRGRFLGELMQIAPGGKHIAYEPIPHFNKLVRELYPAVEVRQAAVSNVIGETTFHYNKHTPAESGLRERGRERGQEIEKLTVRTETLDRSLPEGFIPALIKIDVEGAELQVFEGGIELITRHKPVIVFEHGKGGATYYNTRPQDVYRLLTAEAGLHIFDLDGSGPYSLTQFEDAFAEDVRWDYVARP